MLNIDDVKTITVIGAGLMGHGIAQVALMGGFENVILNDISEDIIDKGARDIEVSLRKLESQGILNDGLSTELLMGRLIKELNLEKAVENADFIIEAIPEVMELKQELFEKIGRIAPNHAVLATNTSTMSITDIGKSSGRVDKVVGMHFFIPLRMKLIEVTRGKNTSDETMKICSEVSERLPCIRGPRTVIQLQKESPGFIVNRVNIVGNMVLSWLIDDAYEKGIPAQALDADVGNFTPMGFYEIWDQLGLDVIFHTTKYFERVLSPQFAPGKVLSQMVKEGRLGKKTRNGFYDYDDNGKIIRKENVKAAGMLDLELLLAAQLNEGCRLLEEGIVSGYKKIDEAMITGMGLPGPFGPGRKNYEKWSQKLEDFSKESRLTYLLPCKLMKSGAFTKMRK